MKDVPMKKKIVGVIGVMMVMLIGAMVHNTVFADDDAVVKKSSVENRKRTTTSSRHRKGKEAPAKEVKQEEVIENLETFVNEFDYKAKQKSVETLAQRA